MKREILSLLTASVLVIPGVAFTQTSALAGAAKWADSAAREIDAAHKRGDIARLRDAKISSTVRSSRSPKIHYYSTTKRISCIGRHRSRKASATAPRLSLCWMKRERLLSNRWP